jgi:phosphatidylglycerol---prolipoprotein diacylglyceryl transferase
MQPFWLQLRPYFMTFPITIFDIHLHLIFEILAYSIGYRYYVFLRNKTTDLINDEGRLWIFIGAAAGAFLGSHILGILENPSKLNSLNLVYFMGNKTIVGGLLGGLIGVEITKKIIGVNTSSGDLMTFPVILALSIGRLGCFAEGLEDGTFGIPTNLPFGINFGDGFFRHPTQLYEIFFLIILGISIYLLENSVKLANGARFKVFMVSYLVFRLMIEFIKPNEFYGFGLCSIQIACIFGLFYYWKVLFMPHKLTQN